MFHYRDINDTVNLLNTFVTETVTQPKTKVEETVKLENPLQLSLFNPTFRTS